jgi:hypothetical protein
VLLGFYEKRRMRGKASFCGERYVCALNSADGRHKFVCSHTPVLSALFIFGPNIYIGNFALVKITQIASIKTLTTNFKST